jgi:sulfoxide reductase heme-binding subunit YedZ
MPFLRERTGRWSPYKIAALAGALVPACWIAWQAVAGELGPRPITEAIHQSGDWALRILLVTLAITPGQRILNLPRLVLSRRILGVATAAYAILHVALYVLDQHFDLVKVAREIVLRFYLLIGALALTGLIALAATSTDAMIRRLGSRRWQALHRCVYGIAILGTAHFFMQSKLNTYQPVLMAGLLVWLLVYRLLHRLTGVVSPPALLLLALAAALVTAGGEAALYHMTSGVNARLVLLAHLDPEMELRPAWWVLAAGLAVAGVAFWRQKPGGQRMSARRMASGALSGATQVQSGS